MKKVHHAPDYAKNTTDDIIKKGSGRAVPNEQWQINVDLTPKGNDSPRDCFNPRPAKDRPSMHVKTNECDH